MRLGSLILIRDERESGVGLLALEWTSGPSSRGEPGPRAGPSAATERARPAGPVRRSRSVRPWCGGLGAGNTLAGEVKAELGRTRSWVKRREMEAPGGGGSELLSFREDDRSLGDAPAGVQRRH
ncbi:hypothetical protein NDU88_004546 [Pleurodeles waltl]|uniref:Uncharacterized protein n=1 Tax=Pleurodeles waltl TaxID=8319 RepID=A0AAV7LLN6_PLEWA|nr:hypothetical protein NDU88_004546 [Pleurodeles waltl]